MIPGLDVGCAIYTFIYLKLNFFYLYLLTRRGLISMSMVMGVAVGLPVGALRRYPEP